MTTGKTIALTRWTFVGNVMSLLLNMLSRLVITFLPRSKRLLISWLQSPSAGISEPKKIKSVTVSIVFPSICYEVMGPLQTFISLNIPVPRVEWASPGGSNVKESTRNTETWVRSLSWEYPLEKGTATHASILAWRIPMERGAWRAVVHEVAESDMTE